MSMKQRKIRQAKKAAKRELINYLLNSVPIPKGLKRILRGLLSTLSLNLMFAVALVFIVFLFMGGV